jgi:hypothetical protein
MSFIREWMDDGFEHYRKTGGGLHFTTQHCETMDREELMAVIGWLVESRNFWREETIRKNERKKI